MNFYPFEDIKSRGDCVAFVEHLGATVTNGRCAAVWRGGDGLNVAVSKEEWYDHKAKVGGGLIELCATAKFGGDIQQAQAYLGQWLGLTPKMSARKLTRSRYDELIALGYKEVCRYPYENLNGELVHFVVRMEHPTLPKEFVQGTPSGWGMGKVVPILYRMSEWVNKSYVCIVEGEKDVETLRAMGIPATTNCGGASKWLPEYADFFKAKNVAILQDNDESGEKHTATIASVIKHVAKKIVVVRPSNLPKGDVTDWMQKEGGSKEALLKLIQQATPLNLDELEDFDPVREAAKAANKTDFSNYIERRDESEKGVKVTKEPRIINDLISDVHKRFCGFPRRVRGGNSVFDHDHATNQIIHLHESADLFAWIGRKSKRRVAWAVGDAMVTKSELYKGLFAEAIAYESISNVPDYPRRADVYYTHPKMPKPSPEHQYFRDFVNFFDPASETYRTMLKAFVCAPLWYVRGLPRPGWIIDSPDGAGAGKTTLVELVARLYCGSPIKSNKQELKTNHGELIKRMVSAEGRMARLCLCDNITGDFHCAELSDLMTAENISGKAPYGRGEEVRPNNLTYVITANSATVDNDLSDRCYYIQVARPKRTGNWKRNVMEYIEKYRYHIFADIIDMLSKAEPLEHEPRTRFPEFEGVILRAVCESEQEYASALLTLEESRAVSNGDDELAKIIEEKFAEEIRAVSLDPETDHVFIRSEVVAKWAEHIIRENPMQAIRNFAKNGLSQRFDAKLTAYPHHGPERRRGILWIPANQPDYKKGTRYNIIALKNNKATSVQHTA